MKATNNNLIFLMQFIYLVAFKLPELQKAGKHKQSRYYKDRYKVKFGIQTSNKNLILYFKG